MAADEKPGWKSWLRSAFRSDIGRVKGWLRSAFCSGFARVKGWLCSPAFWSGVILVVVVCAISYKYESIKSYVPWLITLQLKTYNLISGARQSSLRPVVAVEIDDDTFYGEPHGLAAAIPAGTAPSTIWAPWSLTARTGVCS